MTKRSATTHRADSVDVSGNASKPGVAGATDHISSQSLTLKL